MVHTESSDFAPVYSSRFATIPSGRHISAETEDTQTLVVLELQPTVIDLNNSLIVHVPAVQSWNLVRTPS